MKKTIIYTLGFLVIPVGAIILSGCGPQGTEQLNNEELALDSASDNWIMVDGHYSEYGRCHDAWDNDGDGLPDMADADCHIDPGPLRDLSLYDFPLGHNFFPDATKIPPHGPGVPGGFRDPAQLTEWIRFLTEPDGYVAGIDIYGKGVNPGVVPYPQPLIPEGRQGTFAQGNGNNISIRALHTLFLDHNGILPPYDAPPPRGATAAAVAPKPYEAKAPQDPALSERFEPPFYGEPRGRFPGGWPGEFYQAQGPAAKKWGAAKGSQGALRSAKTGNPDYFNEREGNN